MDINMDMHAELKKLGQRIKQLRLEKGLSQSDLAEAIDKSQEYIAGVEAGTCNLWVTEIGEIARRLETPMSGLFPK